MASTRHFKSHLLFGNHRTSPEKSLGDTQCNNNIEKGPPSRTDTHPYPTPLCRRLCRNYPRTHVASYQSLKNLTHDEACKWC